MGSKERRERERDQTRARIMAAARELFAKEGYDAVSMRRIADAIEYSPTAIYVHFKDKETLFQKLCRDDFAQLADVFVKLAEIQDPVQRILQTGHAYVRFALDYPNHYRMMFMTAHHPAEEQDMAHKGNPDEDAYAFLRLAVREAIEQKRFRPELTDVDLLTQIFWSTAHGIASLQIVKGCDNWVDWSPVEKRAGVGLDAVVRGVLVDPDGLPLPNAKRKAGAK